ncbi:formyltransferase family protein [Prochlorococcus sp. AH-716-M10]|nr:formyltransferase family protein [Prochlorococcus sp. AH-716-M10]
MKKRVLILSNRDWNKELHNQIQNKLRIPVILISSREDLEYNKIKEFDPSLIIAVHWSYKIPGNIWKKWLTIVFHMTDLPYGRGGSPLQNLIARGKEETTITAIECKEKIDSGDIYLKKNLSLFGSAEEIYIRANKIIYKMIIELLTSEIIPKPQVGEAVFFKRRDKNDSNLLNCQCSNLDQWYDLIRMLDADGYPHAYLEINGIKLEFRRVSKRTEGLHADVKITLINKS